MDLSPLYRNDLLRAIPVFGADRIDSLPDAVGGDWTWIITGGFGSRAWSLVIGFTVLFYSIFGAIRPSLLP